MRFCLRKFVEAENATDALTKDATTPVTDVFVDENTSKGSDEVKANPIGFKKVETSFPYENDGGWRPESV